MREKGRKEKKEDKREDARVKRMANVIRIGASSSSRSRYFNAILTIFVNDFYPFRSHGGRTFKASKTKKNK